MRIIRMSFITTLFLTVSQALYAEDFWDDVSFITGVSVGYTEFSFPAKLDHDISSPNLNIPLVLARKRWQLSLNTYLPLEKARISEEEDIGEASRRDLDLTLAYQFSSNWSFFTGYKQGKTSLSFISREDEDEGLSNSLRESYEQKGPYIGTSYAWQFENAGRLSISVAYAALDATNRFGANTDDDDEEEDEALEFDDLTGTVNGDTSGFSYGISWTMPLSGDLLFQTRFKLNDYQQDLRVDGQKYKDIDETYASLHVGLAYVF